ncbi:MAG: hypothetical protein O3B01_26640 [Planctomycetota bacterium]|nr:hypothetical protein [Planctomycetota bacterium]MDA1142155.1 hypothetical protein [Planctomycetota bacterium]
MKDSKYMSILLGLSVILIVGCETTDVRELDPGTAFARFTITFES